MITSKNLELFKQVERISNLVVANLKGTITTQEKENLMQWVNASDHNKKCFEKWMKLGYWEKAAKEFLNVDSESIFEKTMKKIEATNS